MEDTGGRGASTPSRPLYLPAPPPRDAAGSREDYNSQEVLGVGGAKPWRAPQRRAEEQALRGGGGSGERQRPGNHEPLSPILSHTELVLVVPRLFPPARERTLFPPVC